MSENTKKGGVRAVPIVCAATVLAALIVVLFLVLYPSVMARRERTRLAERISAIADASDCAVLRTAMSDYGYGGTADSNKGLVSVEYTPYADYLNLAKELHTNLYPLASYYDAER